MTDPVIFHCTRCGTTNRHTVMPDQIDTADYTKHFGLMASTVWVDGCPKCTATAREHE